MVLGCRQGKIVTPVSGKSGSHILWSRTYEAHRGEDYTLLVLVSVRTFSYCREDVQAEVPSPKGVMSMSR